MKITSSIIIIITTITILPSIISATKPFAQVGCSNSRRIFLSATAAAATTTTNSNTAFVVVSNTRKKSKPAPLSLLLSSSSSFSSFSSSSCLTSSLLLHTNLFHSLPNSGFGGYHHNSYKNNNNKKMTTLRRSSRAKKSTLVAAASMTISTSSKDEEDEEKKKMKMTLARPKAVRPKKKKQQLEEEKKDAAAAASEPENENEMNASSSSSNSDNTEEVKKSNSTKKNTQKRSNTTTNNNNNTDKHENDTDKKNEEEQSSPPPQKKKKRSKSPDHQRITERDVLPKLWDGEVAMQKDGSYTFKIISWNVAGLRALMRNHPNALSDMANKYKPDVICLQETKLQETHVDDPKLKINGHLLHEEGYESYYSCATAKKGYSGTAVFIKKRTSDSKEKRKGGDAEEEKKKGTKKQATIGSFFQPKKGKLDKTETKEEKDDTDDAIIDTSPIGDIDISNLIPVDVSYKLGKSKHDEEGRIITVDFPSFSMSNLYVPNSGQKLDRLGYRTDSWDTDLLAAMQKKEKERNVPVIWLGDLNVAHTAMDVWNDGAKHLAKSAGTTPEERASFQRQLDAGFVDAFRCLHPDAQGQYSYWSQRAGNRPPNKGLRLDYFVCSSSLMGSSDDGDAGSDAEKKIIARDSYILYEQVGSDHCPIVLEMEIKSS